jgi:hypothetical protein
VENFHRCSIRVTVSEPAYAVRSHQRPHAVVEHSKSRRPQLALALGPLLWCRLKKSLHGTGWCFQCREVGDYASNLAVWRRAVWSIGDRLETLAILEQRDGGGTRTTPIWKLEAALKCRSCKKGRCAPPVHLIKLTQRCEITPCVWMHPDDER